MAITVFASTFVALTLTPMLCSRLLRVPERHDRLFRLSEKMFRGIDWVYRMVLAEAFRARWLTLLLGVAVFVVRMLVETDAYARRIEQVLANPTSERTTSHAEEWGKRSTNDTRCPR